MDIPVNSCDNISPTNSSSEPSPLAADAKLKCHIETKRAQSQPPSPSSSMVAAKAPILKELVPEQEQEEEEDREQQQDQEQEQQEVEGNQAHIALEDVKETMRWKSTGSIAILTRQQEALDHRRHTFSTMSADSRANMRRRSYDMTMQSVPFGSTFPPLSLQQQQQQQQQPFPHSFKTHHHLQHLRVYGKSSDSTKSIDDCHEEGASMIAFISPNMDTVWTRGKPVDVEWKVLDTKVSKLRIELLEDGLSATTLIAAEAPNTGFFTYHKVPWGMESGSNYFLRVLAADDLERYRTSCFFQISSAP
ncbi:unnamed protein product [Peronospora belbahrii]|uniref:Yeast cell wall synthesis Kre9/Knh1-like N-terminal domain-containing protein n=1 Tax=Peronospora belbahrii TaxID=622444 RepID=A0AAU9L432_9STRA|nr:unnamed protein product [Peronospora belbahrii]CAH0516357.1 unnamed protein product [Peronospora belbahrii]